MTASPTTGPFFNQYSHGLVRAAVCVPECRVADPAFNARQTIALLQQAAQRKALLAVFPELGLSAYSCDDLFHQRALLDQALAALATVRDATRGLLPIAVVGVPLLIDDRLFNCAVVLRDGRIAGIVPKSYLPGYREYYEPRQFVPASHAARDTVSLLGESVPFGAHLVFDAQATDGGDDVMTFAVEVCEDMWVPLPPSTLAAMAGATVLCNLSASNITIGKADFRHALVRGQSARCLTGYLYCAAGIGESTTDMAWDGQAMIYENGHCLAQAPRFQMQSHLLVADIDVDRLRLERMRMNSFHDCVREHREAIDRIRRVPVPVTLPDDTVLLPERPVERFPYVPAEPQLRDVRCYEAYNIQVAGLIRRMQSTGVSKLVIGVSGGLDSTHALLVAAAACSRLGLPRTNILAWTMPGYATSERTLTNARRLMAAVGCTAAEIDIRPSCDQMLRDLDHPVSRGEPVYDVTFENVQAGERTSHLFRLANQHNGMVLGTGDLSELALGWCTYGVGDHMSHYAINASIPKTLIQYLIRWVAARGANGPNGMSPELPQVLLDILETEISPELVPADEAERAGASQPAQRTEDIIGPYELQDFHLFHTLRTGFRPRKVAFLAWCAWHDASRGTWPDVPDHRRHAYDIGTIRRWLRVFLDRFFRTSQFKRSCIPNAPKVGSGGSLSPRGDWRAPSDSSSAPWLADVDTVPVDGP